MAWPSGTPAWLKQAYGVIQAGVNQNMSTADLINSLRPYAAASSEGWGPRGITIVSQLRGLAAGIREAERAVARDELTGPLVSEHVAVAPWSRDAMARGASPQYAIRARVTYGNPAAVMGGKGASPSLSKWITVKFDHLPTSLGALAGNVGSAGDSTGSLPDVIDTVEQMEILEI